MESKPVSSQTIARQIALADWLMLVCGMDPILLQPMAGDASTRRYFRILHQGLSYVVMDARPPENVQAFSAIANALQQTGLTVPDIWEADPAQGFLLLTDFGDDTYLKTIKHENVDNLYERALQALSLLQSCRHVTVPPFTADFMWQEWSWHKEWFLQKLLGLSIGSELDACYACLVDAAVTQPQVFMHRDYHSANLMVLANQEVGILDFQDAFMGPLTYDLVSLLRDCYVAWPADKVRQWALWYKQKLQLPVSSDEFLYWFDLMSLQRHLKALMTFARKQVRDNQPRYLDHVPRTIQYVLSVSANYPALTSLHQYFQTIVQPAFQQVTVCDVP